MTTTAQDIEKFIDGLKQQRDELVVQLNLAKAEARDELAEIEQQLEHLRAKAANAADEAGEVSQDVWAAAKLLGEEIVSGVERIRNRLG